MFVLIRDGVKLHVVHVSVGTGKLEICAHNTRKHARPRAGLDAVRCGCCVRALFASACALSFTSASARAASSDISRDIAFIHSERGMS